MSILQQPAKLLKLGYILVWAQAVLGGVLFAACWSPLAYGIFLSLAAIALLCVHIGKSRATRVVTRAIISVFWLFVVILAALLAEAIAYGLPEAHLLSLVYGITRFGGLFLCCLSPVAAAALLFHGEHTAVYDRLMGCLILPATVGAAVLSVSPVADVPWTVSGNFLPYVWLVLAAAATVTVWICARVRTPAQQVPIDRHREKRAARIATKNNGVSQGSHR